jgi:hypothetical protein
VLPAVIEQVAAPDEESRKVLKLAIAALEDPYCDTASLVAAAQVADKLRHGLPVSRYAYRAAVVRYAEITREGPREAFHHLRDILLVMLKVEFTGL